ncbi:MAG: TraR/DksA C4-type zinc finger protein [Desulfobacterales bacterium]|nr:TraR/DksA C4-type zinc finger protein [Desulfobacterales bacterium]
MSEQDKMRLRSMLLNRRREIFDRLQHLKSDWQALGERDIELEEEAQKADLTILFDQLNEREKQEIEEIDLALSKMAVLTYGICESCEKSISLKRLEILPATRLCRKCARKYEEIQKRLPSVVEIIACAQVPAQFENLTDAEINELILEHLRTDGRVDLEELNVSFRNAALYLEGAIPSEGEHQILMRILTDILGFECIVDHVEINELIWEREERAPGQTGFELGADVEEISDDVFESEEKQTPYIFPDRPTPEKG